MDFTKTIKIEHAKWLKYSSLPNGPNLAGK